MRFDGTFTLIFRLKKAEGIRVYCSAQVRLKCADCECRLPMGEVGEGCVPIDVM